MTDVLVFVACVAALTFVIGMEVGAETALAAPRECPAVNAAGGRLVATWLDGRGQPIKCSYTIVPTKKKGRKELT